MQIIGRLGPEFTSNYWRRSPLYRRGGARQFLCDTITTERFFRTCSAIGRVSPSQVYRIQDRVVFGQKLDHDDAGLHAVIRGLTKEAAGVSSWFDGVWAADGEGIGSHYDIADSFILQQSGTKVWRLHSPTYIPDDEIRKRLLNETRIDAIYMPDEFTEYVLEPGDLLYIPMLWPHWGVSLGESLSVSLAFSSRNALQWLPRAIALAFTEAGVHETGDYTSSKLLNVLCTERVLTRVRELLWDNVYDVQDPHEQRSSNQVPNELLEFVGRVAASLRKRREWWRPVPVVWTRDEESDFGSENSSWRYAQRYFDHLFEAFERPEGLACSVLAPEDPREFTSRSVRPVRRAPPNERRSIGLDTFDWTVWLRTFEKDRDIATLSKLLEYVEGMQAHRMLVALCRAIEVLPTVNSVDRCHNALDAMREKDDEALRRMANSPAMSMFTWRLAQALEHGHPARLVELVEWLPQLESLNSIAPYVRPDSPPAFTSSEAAHQPRFDYCEGVGRREKASIWRNWIRAEWPRGQLAGSLRWSDVAMTSEESERLIVNQYQARTRLKSFGSVTKLALYEGPILELRQAGTVVAESLPSCRGVVLVASENCNNWSESIVREGLRRIAYDLIDLAPLFKVRTRPGLKYPFLEANSQPSHILFHHWFVACGWGPDIPQLSSASDLRDRLLSESVLTDWGRRFVAAWSRHALCGYP